MDKKIYERYLETSVYTYAGMYKEFLRSLPDDIPSIGMLACGQITHPAILKAKGIPCRCRAGFMDFGNAGESHMEHWVNEYWDFKESRWVLKKLDVFSPSPNPFILEALA